MGVGVVRDSRGGGRGAHPSIIYYFILLRFSFVMSCPLSRLDGVSNLPSVFFFFLNSGHFWRLAIRTESHQIIWVSLTGA